VNAHHRCRGVVSATLDAAADLGPAAASQDPLADLAAELADFQRGVSRPGRMSLVGTMLQDSTDPPSWPATKPRSSRSAAACGSSCGGPSSSASSTPTPTWTWPSPWAPARGTPAPSPVIPAPTLASPHSRASLACRRRPPSRWHHQPRVSPHPRRRFAGELVVDRRLRHSCTAGHGLGGQARLSHQPLMMALAAPTIAARPVGPRRAAQRAHDAAAQAGPRPAPGETRPDPLAGVPPGQPTCRTGPAPSEDHPFERPGRARAPSGRRRKSFVCPMSRAGPGP
jgi:hypothetical protein